MKRNAVVLAAFIAICIMAPFVVTFILSGKKFDGTWRAVWVRTEDGIYESDISEDFVTGMVAAYYRDGDNPEFLKMMAVLARTYEAYLKGDGAVMDAKKLPVRTLTSSEMKSAWGGSYETIYAAVSQAVTDTENEIITYGGRTILPYFHNVSAGWTRPGGERYLKSTACPDDINDADYVTIKDLALQDTINILKNSVSDISFDGSPADVVNVISRDEAGYATEIKTGDRTVTGDELINILGLPSAAFTVICSQDSIRFTVKGYGSGYGVSLSTARKKAEEGSSYREILNYFYNDIVIEK